MNEVKIIDVYAVYGDFCNVGGGVLIGVFEEEKIAEKHALGRGNIDCYSLNGHGNNGRVEKKKAVRVEDEIYLLEIGYLIQLNKVLRDDRRVSQCVAEEPKPYFRVKVTYVGEPIEFMKFIRAKTGMSFAEVKQVCDKARKTHDAMVEPMHNALDNQISKEEFQNWKQELGLRQIAEIEAC